MIGGLRYWWNSLSQKPPLIAHANRCMPSISDGWFLTNHDLLTIIFSIISEAKDL